MHRLTCEEQPDSKKLNAKAPSFAKTPRVRSESAAARSLPKRTANRQDGQDEEDVVQRLLTAWQSCPAVVLSVLPILTICFALPSHHKRTTNALMAPWRFVAPWRAAVLALWRFGGYAVASARSRSLAVAALTWWRVAFVEARRRRLVSKDGDSPQLRGQSPKAGAVPEGGGSPQLRGQSPQRAVAAVI